MVQGPSPSLASAVFLRSQVLVLCTLYCTVSCECMCTAPGPLPSAKKSPKIMYMHTRMFTTWLSDCFVSQSVSPIASRPIVILSLLAQRDLVLGTIKLGTSSTFFGGLSVYCYRGRIRVSMHGGKYSSNACL